MSLRAFHLLLIALSIVLAAVVASWSGGAYQREHGWPWAAMAAGSAASGIVLLAYGVRFERRSRRS